MVDAVPWYLDDADDSGDERHGERRQKVHDLFRTHEIELTQPILDYLGDKNSVDLIGPTSAEARAPTRAVKLQAPGYTVAKKRASYGVRAGGGDLNAARQLEAMKSSPEHGGRREAVVQ